MSQDRLGTFNYAIHFSDSANFFKGRLFLLKGIMMLLKRDAIHQENMSMTCIPP